MALSSDELKAIGEALLASMAPAIESAVKTAVDAAVPTVARPLADLALDEIDSLIAAHLPQPTPAGSNPPTVAPVGDLASQVANLQTHVAALTVATGNATSANFAAVKAGIAATAAAAAGA